MEAKVKILSNSQNTVYPDQYTLKFRYCQYKLSHA